MLIESADCLFGPYDFRAITIPRRLEVEINMSQFKMKFMVVETKAVMYDDR